MAKRRFLVTSALPYSNGRLHVGHIAGAYLPADTYVRYLRSRGDEVRFICGSDDNGVASLITARKQGTTVEELTARYNARQTEDFKGLGIEFREVREYVPGDDIRTIDWNVTARTGQPYVKLFDEERELTVMLAADVSGSDIAAPRGRHPTGGRNGCSAPLSGRDGVPATMPASAWITGSGAATVGRADTRWNDQPHDSAQARYRLSAASHRPGGSERTEHPRCGRSCAPGCPISPRPRA